MKKSLVWQFYKKEGETPNYLIGTMHIRDERAFLFEQDFKNAIEKCTVFATEFNLDDLQTGANELSLVLPEGQTLKDLIVNKLYKKIDGILLKKLGIPLDHFAHLKPIALTNFLMESQFSNDRWLSLDETLWQFAKEKGKILRGIETLEEQVSILGKMTVEEQIEGLKTTLKNFSSFQKQMAKMASLFEQADIEKLYKAAKKSAKSNRKLLLYNRNYIMADRIEILAKQDSICVAIGAGHLAGGKGVLRLLKKKGFIIKAAAFK